MDNIFIVKARGFSKMVAFRKLPNAKEYVSENYRWSNESHTYFHDYYEDKNGKDIVTISEVPIIDKKE